MDVQVNEVYRVNHVRKGKFVMGVTKVDDEFVKGFILEGRAHYISVENNLMGRGYPGDMVTVRRSLCTFAPWPAPEGEEANP